MGDSTNGTLYPLRVLVLYSVNSYHVCLRLCRSIDDVLRVARGGEVGGWLVGFGALVGFGGCAEKRGFTVCD
jgi:hypothetical protein